MLAPSPPTSASYCHLLSLSLPETGALTIRSQRRRKGHAPKLTPSPLLDSASSGSDGHHRRPSVTSRLAIALADVGRRPKDPASSLTCFLSLWPTRAPPTIDDGRRSQRLVRQPPSDASNRSRHPKTSIDALAACISREEEGNVSGFGPNSGMGLGQRVGLGLHVNIFKA